MKQDISINGELSPLNQHNLLSRGSIGVSADTSNIHFHKRECAAPSTPLARQHSFKDAPRNEGVKRILNASLRVEGNFDALDPEPAVAHAFFAQEVGAAGLAVFPRKGETLRLRMLSKNTV
jgi:hypothetical protein